ncbi:hypothetical protein SBADM41S_00544 [Streptomyces badius]
MCLASTPDAWAAVSLAPVARRSKPNRVRFRANQYRTPHPAATKVKP